MANKFIITFMLLTLGYADVSFNYNGKFSHFFALRNSNNKILNIPFRMIDLNTSMQLGYNFEVKSLLSAQYHNTIDDYFNTKNISGEVRELYGTYYFNSGEISFGRKLFTLGSVDENSPIDHFNPYNYYYLLIGGLDKKVSVDALSFDFYLGENYQISGAYSPNHNINHYPENDPEYELSLPLTPTQYQFLDNKGSSHESFLSLKKSNLNNEFSLTYIRAFDRVFSLSGFTIHEFQGNNTFDEPDIWFSNRLTESINFGSVLLLNDITIRSDIGLFHSFDRYNRNDYLDLKDQIDIQLGSNFYNQLYDQMDIDGDGLNDLFNAALEEDAVYTQITLQAELPLPNDWQINTQFFIYNLIDYSLVNYTFSDVSVTLPLATIDMNEVINEDGDYFTPGFGSSMATLSQKSILFGIEKYMLDNNLKSTFTTFFDLDKGDGKLMSFELEYEISNNINLLFGSTKIFGDESIQPESDFDLGYTFNLMEDFSHNRIQLNYYF
mgnify:FL=1|tara:strand:+ start:767 stop:2251 length:1485 start_codon:yes stop_codon:yes gene_type:complete